MWPCSLLLALGAFPLFGPRADNSWDSLRDVFYRHRFSNGQVYEHEESIDNPPWITWKPFYENKEFYEQARAALDKFLKLPKSEVEDQPALRRAVFLRDLWPVFDAQVEREAAVGAAAERQAELRSRVAKVMRRLELSDAEVARLPDNYKAALAAKLFSPSFDSGSPEKGFMPPDLFDESGPWTAMARDKKTVGGFCHLETVRYRSIFVTYIHVSDKRQDSIDYLNKYQRHENKSVPKGTLLALVRHMVLPTQSGHVRQTPVVESLQFIIVDPPHDHRFKYVLDRAGLIAGRLGLRQLTKDDLVDAYGFESGGLFPHKSKMDSDGEMLVLGQFAGSIRKGERLTFGPAENGDALTSLGHCMACHGTTVGRDLFANCGEYFHPVAMSADEQIKIMLSHKEVSPEWKAYKAARN